MEIDKKKHISGLVTAALVLTLLAEAGSQHGQTLAPHELKSGDAPAAIEWEPPGLPRHAVKIESAEKRKLHVDQRARVARCSPVSGS
jgi:hypothetical protein